MPHLRRFEQISSLESTRKFSGVVEQALAARAMLERVWSADTAFQGITLQPDDVVSRGQCGVSAVWFAQHLASQGVDTSVAEGKIHLLSGEGDDHVWVEVRGVSTHPLVVDLTSDQYQSHLASTVHIGEYAGSDEVIGRYTPLEQMDPYNMPRRKLMARYAILESAIEHLPRRHRVILR